MRTIVLSAAVTLGLLAGPEVHAEIEFQNRCVDFTGDYTVFRRDDAGKASGTARITCERGACTLLFQGRSAKLQPLAWHISRWRVIPTDGAKDWPRRLTVQDGSDCTTLLFGNGTLWQRNR